MMKEIKYRAYSKRTKKVYHVLAIFFYQKVVKLSKICGSGISFLEQIDDVVLMQYTGLEDKNDVEIYEGDIIKTHFYSNPYVDEYGGFHEPTDSVVTAVVKNEGFCIPVLLADYQSVEVVGNIYENKDLLEG